MWRRYLSVPLRHWKGNSKQRFVQGSQEKRYQSSVLTMLKDLLVSSSMRTPHFPFLLNKYPSSLWTVLADLVVQSSITIEHFQFHLNKGLLLVLDLDLTVL